MFFYLWASPLHLVIHLGGEQQTRVRMFYNTLRLPYKQPLYQIFLYNILEPPQTPDRKQAPKLGSKISSLRSYDNPRGLNQVNKQSYQYITSIFPLNKAAGNSKSACINPLFNSRIVIMILVHQS